MDGVPAVVASVAHVLRELRLVGVWTVLWTFVVCATVWHSPGPTVEKLWPFLYFTWLGLVGAQALSVVGMTAWSTWKGRGVEPVVAKSQAPGSTPALE